MMRESFHTTVRGQSDEVVTVEIGFGAPATNVEIVRDAMLALSRLGLKGGRGIHFTGPASLPAAMAMAHAVAHLYGYVACWDPKLDGYVVAISHDPAVRAGDLVRDSATPG